MEFQAGFDNGRIPVSLKGLRNSKTHKYEETFVLYFLIDSSIPAISFFYCYCLYIAVQ